MGGVAARSAGAPLLARLLGRMLVLAPVLGVGSVLVGLVASYRLDLPSGPSIVAVAGMAFLVAWARTAWARGPRGRARPRA